MDNTEPNKWLIEQIDKAISEEKTSRNAVADATGISYSTFWRYMQGGGSFDWDQLMRIATALNRPPAYFTPPQFQHAKEAA